MKALGLDPGYDRLGVAIVDNASGHDTVVYSTCVETNTNEDLSQRLVHIGHTLTKILETYQPDIVGVETLFFNKNVKTAIGVAQARGVLLYLVQLTGCELYELSPQEIKVALTGYGKSDKAAVLAMVQRLVHNVPAAAVDDEYDAIAAAVTALAHHR